MGGTRDDVQQEEFVYHIDPDADEGGDGQEAPDPQGQRGSSGCQYCSIYDTSYCGWDCVPTDPEHDGDVLFEGWCSLLVRAFIRSEFISPDSSPFASAILFASLSSMSEIPTLFAHRPIILRHRKAAMYHPFIEAAAMTLVDIPITSTTLTVYSLVLYFVVGLQATTSQFT